MKILGLTGSVGMGKSTAAKMLRNMGVPVYDADASVHQMMRRGGTAVAKVAAAFPGVERDGAIDRTALGKRVFGDEPAMKRLEAIIHPLVREDEKAFLAAQRRRKTRLVVMDVPLLFESGRQKRYDATMVVTAPALLQRARVMARPGMTTARYAAILARQMPDVEKRKRADFIVPSGLGRAVTWRSLRAALRKLAR
ncbi:MAG TPA: dephospho-CoA kinase [Stellaceae bacterium]|jgi:dephospho-CoA kinase|nr:dephospho-CoA kinase [Stellaceae bacterium]